jgi:glycosyltransferase involved in cell wall biosynthesis
MNSKFFSIITVTFNSEKTIEETILSVLNQTCKDFEYIVIDGKSSDNTIGILKKYEKYLTISSLKDNGIADAMNKGILKSNGKWLHILNSDDIYFDKFCLENAKKCLLEDKLNYFQMYFSDINGVIKSKNNWEYNFFTPYLRACIPHPSMILTKDQYNKIGLYDERFTVTFDHDLTLRLLRAQLKPVKHNFVLTVKRDGGVTHQNQKKVIYEFRLILIKNRLPIFLANLIFILKILLMYIKNIFK